MNYTELTNKLVAKALKYGASSAEVYLKTSRNLSIQVLNGEIENLILGNQLLWPKHIHCFGASSQRNFLRREAGKNTCFLFYFIAYFSFT